jgi:hypothetical protein
MMRSLAATEIVPQPVKAIGTTIMPIYCAWCQKRMGSRMTLGNNDPSHGICRKCYHRMLTGIQAATKEKGD